MTYLKIVSQWDKTSGLRTLFEQLKDINFDMCLLSEVERQGFLNSIISQYEPHQIGVVAKYIAYFVHLYYVNDNSEGDEAEPIEVEPTTEVEENVMEDATYEYYKSIAGYKKDQTLFDELGIDDDE